MEIEINKNMNTIIRDDSKPLLDLIRNSFYFDKIIEKESNIDKINDITNILDLKIDSIINKIGNGI